MIDYKAILDMCIMSVPLSVFLLAGGILPLIVTVLSLIFLLVRFLTHLEKYHKRSFKCFFKWCWSWLKKN